MTQLVINHCGKISNLDAINVVAEFVQDVVRSNGLLKSREAYTRSGQFVSVCEVEHKNCKASPCSSVFEIKIIEQ